MKVYRMKHIPTGLYFCNARDISVKKGAYPNKVKSQLSEKGKVFSHKPNFRYLGGSVCTHTEVKWEKDHWDRDTPHSTYIPFVESEWIIEEGEF